VPGVGRLSELQELNLHGCGRLAQLPEDLGQAAALRRLDLSYCRALARLPDSVGRLSELRSLSLFYCRRGRRRPACLSIPPDRPPSMRARVLFERRAVHLSVYLQTDARLI
jgi:hypothetical protein